jgi:hypothetical protein
MIFIVLTYLRLIQFGILTTWLKVVIVVMIGVHNLWPRETVEHDKRSEIEKKSQSILIKIKKVSLTWDSYK